MVATMPAKIPGAPFFIGEGLSGAAFSPCRRYRWSLWRRWVADCEWERMCAFVGLNPSTADEHENDRTINRCIAFAKQWGFDGLVMLNLFAWCDTKPEDMFRAADPIGLYNDEVLQIVPALCGRTVLAWGAVATNKKLGVHANRCAIVRTWMREYPEVFYLRLTKFGQPEHPLYLPGNLVPQRLEK